MKKTTKPAGKAPQRSLSTAQNAFQNWVISAKVFTLIIAICFTGMAYGQTRFDNPVGINTAPGAGLNLHVSGDARFNNEVGISATPITGINLHVSGQIRFSGLPTSSGVNSFLSINPANGDVRRQAGSLLPSSGLSNGETAHWSSGTSAWIVDDYLYNDGAFVGVGGITTAPTITMNAASPNGSGTWLPGGGGTGGGSAIFGVDGDVSINGDYYGANIFVTSDARLKEDINSLSDWKKIFDIQAYSYKFIGQEHEGLSYGFLAQDVNKVLPELTSLWGDAGTVNYIGFIPFLSQGLKEHEERLSQLESGSPSSDDFQQEIADLQEANRELKDQNVLLQQRLERLEQRFNDICEMPCVQGDNPKPVDRTNGKTIELNDPPALFQNEPNPFTSLTHIRYYLPEGNGNGTLLIRNSEGKTVGEYQITQSGHGSISIQPATLTPGTYFYTLMINGREHETKKMTLINN